jgi:hypothetical protein
MRVRIVIVALLALLPASAMAEGSNAGFGMGGNFSRFDPVVAQYNASGELFRISGHCQSSCTLFLGIRSVCIERSASLLFHFRPRPKQESQPVADRSHARRL